ncbi:hypothetical protein P152DRAFT_506325 [Eremomyces bilateralis CBS 781.70]|uniref:JmjC domain-containing protein n=1 Tax=Eremomyces bilateralis CBS 781.70 TaxID=1392243 RepID=A0A6G1G8P0_9PEZI|nr:uncharacterized protein P152DRAFT_506325 [Eremomyces bilateralis CBS 781.70]KAF1814465.1 hypothetical protein P152DRAFT_506325 [Eremomyces bilateralis CBS 781.70]
MPANRPRAAFEPIPPAFDLHRLVEETPNFQWVDRISFDRVQEQPAEVFDKLILLHVIQGGKPLVIEGLNESLDAWTFTEQWLRSNHGDKVENARNITLKDNIPLTIGHYLKHMGILTEQFFESANNYRDKNRQRIYLKDIDCPPVWADKLKDVIPHRLFYLNESTGDVGGAGAIDEFSSIGVRKGRGIATAGDLMSSLPPEMRAENLMCYIGHEGTYTPAHREMCASLGQNIMVEASGKVGDNGKAERPGSSIWFMTETKDRHTVQEYWLSVLGHDIEVETHFAQMMAWKKAPFQTYVVEQKPGDFILIPPLAPHQVWNRGTRTMKVAWNRTTVETLELAFNEALVNSRMVCRDEQYKNKAIVYFTLLKYSQLLRRVKTQIERNDADAENLFRSKKVRQVKKDFVKLFKLFKSIVISEMFSPNRPTEKPEYIQFDGNVTCSYCRGDVFNRFLTCKTCMDVGTGVDEPYDICMECYVMGRSCKCQSGYQWVEQWKWKELTHRYEEWRRQIIEFEGGVTRNTPQSLEEERELYHPRNLAELCQEQLELRPWVDVNSQEPERVLEELSDEEIPFGGDGRVKKRVNRKPNPGDYDVRCHVCLRFHPRWMVQICTGCERPWCYGTLWRAHDKMPQEVMEDKFWECPHCKKECNAGACRKDPRQTPYEPKGTLLGHDTKKIADMRSVEVLVDFSKANLNWLGEKPAGTPGNNIRLERRREEAERAKRDDPLQDDDDHDLADGTPQISFEPDGDTLIDPRLEGTAAISGENNGLPGEGNGNSDSSLFPDLLNPKSKKRSRFSEANGGLQKKRKADEAGSNGAPKKIASKQYQQEQEKKRLDKAKKDGRYIQTLAAMRGKRKLIKLNLQPDNFRTKLLEIQAAKRKGAPNNSQPSTKPRKTTTLLQSDITQANELQLGTPFDMRPKKPANIFKARVEEDAEYRSRARPKKNKLDAVPSASRPRTRVQQFEDIEVDSDEEMTEVLPKKDRRRERRGSGDNDIPDELPDNWKDGMANPRRNKTSTNGGDRRPTMAQKALRIRPSGTGASADNINVDGTASDTDSVLDSPDRKRGNESHRATAKSTGDPSGTANSIAQSAAKMLGEENRRVKLLAARWAEGEDVTMNDSPDAASVGAPGPTMKKTRKSGRPRAGPASKVKQSVPAKGRTVTETTIEISSGESSDDSSENEIPSGLATPNGRVASSKVVDVWVKRL